MTSKLQSIKVNGKHIGNVSKTPHAYEWKAWSAIARVSVNGRAQQFTAKTKAECTAWLRSVAKNAA